MKLLLDENLSRLVESLSEAYPGSVHVHGIGPGAADDSEVWEYAKAQGFAIVSKDADFAETQRFGELATQGDLVTAWELPDKRDRIRSACSSRFDSRLH